MTKIDVAWVACWLLPDYVRWAGLLAITLAIASLPSIGVALMRKLRRQPSRFPRLAVACALAGFLSSGVVLVYSTYLRYGVQEARIRASEQANPAFTYRGVRHSVDTDFRVGAGVALGTCAVQVAMLLAWRSAAGSDAAV